MDSKYIKMEEFLSRVNNARTTASGVFLITFAFIWALCMFVVFFPLIGVTILFTVLLYVLFFPFIKLEEYIKRRNKVDE